MYTKTYHNIRFHIIFSTKNRAPLITDHTLKKIRTLLKEKAKELGIIIHIVNGIEDHVHILISSIPGLSISKLVKHLKGFTSHEIDNLYWQKGYSAFSVDRFSFDRIFKYIKNQKLHHGNYSFEKELIRFKKSFR